MYLFMLFMGQFTGPRAASGKRQGNEGVLVLHKIEQCFWVFCRSSPFSRRHLVIVRLWCGLFFLPWCRSFACALDNRSIFRCVTINPDTRGTSLVQHLHQPCPPVPRGGPTMRGLRGQTSKYDLRDVQFYQFLLLPSSPAREYCIDIVGPAHIPAHISTTCHLHYSWRRPLAATCGAAKSVQQQKKKKTV